MDTDMDRDIDFDMVRKSKSDVYGDGLIQHLILMFNYKYILHQKNGDLKNVPKNLLRRLEHKIVAFDLS
jgi:hypothetical protein